MLLYVINFGKSSIRTMRFLHRQKVHLETKQKSVVCCPNNESHIPLYHPKLDEITGRRLKFSRLIILIKFVLASGGPNSTFRFSIAMNRVSGWERIQNSCLSRCGKSLTPKCLLSISHQHFLLMKRQLLSSLPSFKNVPANCRMMPTWELGGDVIPINTVLLS